MLFFLPVYVIYATLLSNLFNFDGIIQLGKKILIRINISSRIP